MKIILNVNGKEEIHTVESNVVIVGRSTQCQIAVKSDHISRQHLEVTQRDGNYFAKDLTLGNWVSYNGEKMEKGVEIQVFDFCEILLPGNITVKISDKEDGVDDEASRQFNFDSLQNEANEKTVKKRNKKKLKLELDSDIYQDLVNTNTGTQTREILDFESQRKKVKEKESSKKFILLLIFILTCGGITSFLMMSGNSKKVRKPRAKSVRKPTPKRRTKRRNKKAVKKLNNSELSLSSQLKAELSNFSRLPSKCSGQNGEYCKAIFKQRNSDEGIIAKDKILTVYKDYDLRLVQLFSGQAAGYVAAKNIFYTEYIVAAHNILDPNFLAKVEKNGLFKVRVILFSKKNGRAKLKSSFSIDSSHYRRFNSADYFKSIDLFINSQDYSKFQRVFNKYITKEI